MNKKIHRRSSRLDEISIRGLGVIEEATAEFAGGLNVITGETGAGKTMVLTALSMILGGKSDSSLVRSGFERLLINGRFIVGDEDKEIVSQTLEDHGGEIDEGVLLISRNVMRDGKSRATLGGAAITSGVLSETTSKLVAIHGQHASLSLSKANKQRDLLDSFAGENVKSALDVYQKNLRNFQELKERIKDLRVALASRDRELSELTELVNESSKLKPKSHEIEELSQLISRLSSVEDLRSACSAALEALDNEETGGLNGVGAARRFLTNAKGRDAKLDDISDVIQEAFFSLSDAASSLTRYLEDLNADPFALEQAQARKAALVAFAKKFGSGDYDSTLLRAQEAQSRMKDLLGGEDAIVELENQASVLHEQLTVAARDLSLLRSSAAKDLGSAITAELASLSMPHGKFEIVVNSLLPAAESQWKESGIDEIEMRFTSHGGDLLPIAKAASGGELSRLLLAIEVTIAGREQIPTYVFDEVDAGIGGKAALEVGRRLRALARHAQVIVVTHLPQVAIWADRHIVISKSDAGAITRSSLHVVDGAERENEIARMLSGLEDSEHAQEHARELLELRKRESA